MDAYTTIDGTLGEGGGQMLRLALAFSVITQKPFKMINIRSRRPNPGINNQLTSQINLIAQLVQADVEGLRQGSLEVTFTPRKVLQEKHLFCGAKSAQSITLVLQSLLPLLVNSECSVKVEGGTCVSNSPSIKAYKEGFLSYLEKMGIESEIAILKEGYYPQGGGCVKLSLKGELKPIQIIQRKPFNKVQVEYLLAHDVDVTQYDQQLQQKFGLPIESVVKLVNQKKFKNAYGLVVLLKSDDACFDCSFISQQDTTIQALIDGVNVPKDDVLDEHMQDQLLPYMVLTKGQSKMKISHLSDHSKSAIYVIQHFMPDLSFDYNDQILTVN